MKKRYTIYVEPEVWKKIKVRAVMAGMSASEYVERASCRDPIEETKDTILGCAEEK